jgi:FAD/FMN-containing dehydrogenase
MLEEKNFKWDNWAGNHSCLALNYFEPETEEQVKEIVRFAAENKKKIRVAGAGHSFSPIALSNEVLVSLKNFRKLISIDNNFVTTQGGIYLYELYATLKQNRLSLPNFGVINKQTLAGALATGTHGSGLKHKSISAAIERMKILTASGEIIEINRDSILNTAHGKLNLWEAASISLGMLGIVMEVTLKCEPLFYLKSEEFIIDFDEYLEKMDTYAARYEYFKAWWFPHTGEVYIFNSERVDEETYRNKAKLEKYSALQKQRDKEIDEITSPLFIESNEDNSLIPQINKYALDHFFTPRTRIGDSFEILVHDETVPMIVSEYGISMENDHHKRALKEFRDALESSGLKVHFPVDLRYTGAEASWLSSSYNHDTFYIGVCIREYRKKEIPASMILFFDIMKKYHAVPNWGKLSDLTKAELKEKYPRLMDFIEVKNHFDPNGIFENEFTERIFRVDV